MTSFDDREQGFEARFAHDEELEFRAVSRRNKLVARWAAERMGLAGEHVEDYVRAVIHSEVKPSGDSEVFRKIAQDLKASGVTFTESEIQARMDEFLAVARDQVRQGE